MLRAETGTNAAPEASGLIPFSDAVLIQGDGIRWTTLHTDAAARAKLLVDDRQVVSGID